MQYVCNYSRDAVLGERCLGFLFQKCIVGFKLRPSKIVRGEQHGAKQASGALQIPVAAENSVPTLNLTHLEGHN
jgi:hypothetical protein